MWKKISLVLLLPLMGMTCNPDPQPYVDNSQQCVQAMAEFARESKERGKQMAVVANILGRSSLREEEQTKVLKQLAREMKSWRCAPIDGVQMSPVPIPTPNLLGD